MHALSIIPVVFFSVPTVAFLPSSKYRASNVPSTQLMMESSSSSVSRAEFVKVGVLATGSMLLQRPFVVNADDTVTLPSDVKANDVVTPPSDVKPNDAVTTPSDAKPNDAVTIVTLPSGVSYTVTKAGSGPKPQIGQLAAIRFKAVAGKTVIDDIYGTQEPYYTRVGSGGLIKGVEEVLPKMRVGDRWVLTVPGKLAFGSKGRPASAGKPRIPADTTVIFDVEMVGLPGLEPELIDIIGDD